MNKALLVVLILALITLPLVACGYQRTVSIDLGNLNRQLHRLQSNIPGINITSYPRIDMRLGSWLRWFLFPVASIWRIIVSAALAWLVYTVMPQNILRIGEVAEREPLRAILYGLLGYLAIVPAAILLAITIVGILLLPVLGLGVGIAQLFGQAAIGLWVGRAINKAISRDFNETQQLMLGVVAIGILTSIPGAGGLVGLFVGLLGFGATLWTQFGRNAVA